MTSRLNELVAAAKVLLVGKDAQGRGTILLVTERNDIGTTVFLNPAFRGRLALEFGDDAGVGGHQSLRHRGDREI